MAAREVSALLSGPVSEVRLGIDVGGSGVKGALVDIATGKVISQRFRVDTPQPADPPSIAAAVATVAAELGGEGTVGIGFPAVIKQGVVYTASNIDPSCIGIDGVSLFSEALGRQAVVINDADAAGIAEARFGQAKGVAGVGLVITFGTGIGSALLHDGELVPNLELGQIELDGVFPAEDRFAAKAMTDEGLSWEEWGNRANRFLSHVSRLFSPTRIVVGGGVVTKWDMYAGQIDAALNVVPASLGKNAGIIGAAGLAAPSG